MSVLFSMRAATSALVFAGFWLVSPDPAQAVPCRSAPPTSFDVREDPFNLSAEERDAIIEMVHAFALTWDLRDEVNLPLLFIDGDQQDGFWFSVCNSSLDVSGTGTQIHSATTRTQLRHYFNTGPFCYVEGGVESGNDCEDASGNDDTPDTTSQARHFISNIIVKSHQLGDVKVVADLLVTLQYAGNDPPVADPAFPVVDYTGMIEAVLTKEWGGVWKFRELMIYMDVAGEADSFRGR